MKAGTTSVIARDQARIGVGKFKRNEFKKIAKLVDEQVALGKDQIKKKARR